jgi:hypothetical protein
LLAVIDDAKAHHDVWKGQVTPDLGCPRPVDRFDESGREFEELRLLRRNGCDGEPELSMPRRIRFEWQLPLLTDIRIA